MYATKKLPLIEILGAANTIQASIAPEAGQETEDHEFWKNLNNRDYGNAHEQAHLSSNIRK